MAKTKFLLNSFQPSDAFHIKPRYFICTVNQMTGFYMKSNTGLKILKQKKYIVGHIYYKSGGKITLYQRQLL